MGNVFFRFWTQTLDHTISSFFLFFFFNSPLTFEGHLHDLIGFLGKQRWN